MEEILSKTDEWEKWHDKQLVSALAEVGVPVLGSMNKSKEAARLFVRLLEERPDYGLSREEFEKQVNVMMGRFLWSINPRKDK
ncbi:hypothetical protein PHYNN_220 [Pantoea phage Phynn]|nr:hypothetical protein PHYNN_220 [Pantoea phage Phynn]